MNEAVEVPIPLGVRLLFGRAAMQVVADEIGVDVLHIKGNAVDPSLRPGETSGSDVDVLVHPDRIATLDRALRARGWRLYSTFVNGSPFGHAQTYIHDDWGYLDVHRWFPGIRNAPNIAFERMWRDSRVIDFVGVGCRVPSLAAQAVLLVLNAARGSGDTADVALSWTDASDEFRAEVERLTGELDARVAFAAGAGDLDRHRGAPDYRLWKVVSEGGTRAEEWWARVRSAPTLREALGIAARAPLVNIEHLSIELGRAPTRREIVTEFFARPARGVGEGFALLRARWRRRSK